MHVRLFFSIGIIVIPLITLSFIETEPVSVEKFVEAPHEDVLYSTTTIESEYGTSFLFVGDIMLGRYVEDLSLQHGFDYPYRHLLSVLQKPDYTIGNFEGSVPSKHIPTKAYEMQFSFMDEAFHHVALSGFDILSLANNHTDDYGIAGYQNTLNLCVLYDIICGGHPSIIDDESVTFVSADKETVALIFLDGTNEVAYDTLEMIIRTASQHSDLQFVFIHWGEEYALQNNVHQQKLAHHFIDAGADLVVGHHPHVVQNIELYKGVPIFYSLGNFIFDQYFSPDVMDGMMLGVELSVDQIQFSLIGVTTENSVGSPMQMSIDDEQSLFQRIFFNIKANALVDVKNGVIVIKR